MGQAGTDRRAAPCRPFELDRTKMGCERGGQPGGPGRPSSCLSFRLGTRSSRRRSQWPGGGRHCACALHWVDTQSAMSTRLRDFAKQACVGMTAAKCDIKPFAAIGCGDSNMQGLQAGWAAGLRCRKHGAVPARCVGGRGCAGCAAALLAGLRDRIRGPPCTCGGTIVVQSSGNLAYVR